METEETTVRIVTDWFKCDVEPAAFVQKGDPRFVLAVWMSRCVDEGQETVRMRVFKHVGDYIRFVEDSRSRWDLPIDAAIKTLARLIEERK